MSEYMQSIERQIARQCVSDLLAAGYTISVYDGEEYALKRSKNAKAIIAAMASTDTDTLVAYDRGINRVGTVMFVYGNGCDVMADWSMSLEENGTLAKSIALVMSF